MKNITKLLILTLVPITLVGCGKTIPVLKNGEEAVVTLNEGSISANELYNEIKVNSGTTVLIDLVDKLILNKKYKETDEEKAYIDEQINSLKENAESYYGMSYEELIKNSGFENEDEVKEYFRLSYRREQAVNDYVGKTIKEKEIEKYYEDKIFGEINVKHILIAPETLDGMTSEETKKAEEEALKEAKEVIKKLKNGEKWDDLAKKYSDDSSNAEKGGDLGWITTGEMVEEFEKAAFELKKGNYTTSPVKTTYGYHIIYKVDEKEKPSYKDSKDGIIDTLVSKKLEEDTTLYYKALDKVREESGLDIIDTDLNKGYRNYITNKTTVTSNN